MEAETTKEKKGMRTLSRVDEVSAQLAAEGKKEKPKEIPSHVPPEAAQRQSQQRASSFALVTPDALQQEKQKVKLMNTYKLDSDHPFNPEPVEKIMKEVMKEKLQDVRYDATLCMELAKQISADVRARVKKLKFDRYKLVVYTAIGEKRLHGIQMCTKFLWDFERDSFAFSTFESFSLFCVVSCYGLYFE